MNASPPPTPSLTTPRRFKAIHLPCERVEDYRPGGYHPVHLGDLFKNGQYKVIRKLGEGSYSTVWMAHDPEKKRYVALKILVSKFSESTNELRILHHIGQVAPAQAAEYTTQLLDDFEHRGPNGLHQCLVFELMGPTVNTMVEDLPQFKPRVWGMKIRYPTRMAKSILKQSLKSLAFLHEHGIAHGDLQPGNMLFALDDIDSRLEDMIQQDDSHQSELVQRLDGKKDLWAPRYLYVGQPLASLVNHTGEFKIKLSDMGGAYFFANPPTKLITPTGLRAPEQILAGAVNNTLDVWSFGCLVFELITGQPLFCVPWYDSEVKQDDDHLLSLTTTLGPLPDELYGHWKTSSLYFTPQRKLFNFQLGGVAEGAEPLVIEQPTMEEMFDQANPDLSEEEAYRVKSLIRRILQYDPVKRPSPAEILRDPWFCN